MNPPYFPPSIFYIAFGVFWIFLIWVLWMIVKSLRGIDVSLKEISQGPKDKS